MTTWGQTFLSALKQKGFGLCAFVPDSRFESIIEAMAEDRGFKLVSVTREEEGVGVAAGASLSGTLGVVMMQSTGLGNCINGLGSLPIAQRIPVLLVMSERGHLGEEVQTQIPLGQGMRKILDAMAIPHYTITSEDQVGPLTLGAAQLCRAYQSPVAIFLGQQFAIKGGAK